MSKIIDENYSKIAEKLSSLKHVLITSHINPDGDNIASVVALGAGLELLGKSVTLVLVSPVPHIYKFISGSERIVDFKKLDEERPNFDCAMVLDVGSLKRVGETVDLRKYTKLVMNIDHHVKTENCGDISFVDSSYSSTAEIIYNLLTDLGVKITPEIAEALYVGIMTDTGGFQFQNTTASAMKAVSELIALGASPEKISQKVYFSNRAAKIVLMGKVLSTLKFDPSGKIGWITATKEVIDECGANSDDLENVINNLTSIETIEVAILFRDLHDGKIKLSLRARNSVDVQKFALKYQGGGHKKASGMVLDATLEDAVNRVIFEFRDYIREYVKN